MNKDVDEKEGVLFEQDIRRIASALWPSAQHGGPGIINNKERDGIFITEECVHILECTVSRRLQKAQDDIQKLEEAYLKFQTDYPDRPCKCWFVTKHPPTPDQQDAARASKFRITAIDRSAFQAKLIDIHSYFEARAHYNFGSISDPTGGKRESEIRYIDVPIIDRAGSLWVTERIANSLLAGECFTLLGDYGIGKSMTLRETFRHLSKKYYQGGTIKFPIYLNLRDHQTQTNPAEILSRHADRLGFSNSHHLIRAWRAGYVVLLLDGFDEVGSVGLTGAWRELPAARHQAMTGIRKLIRESPSGTGIALAGRHTFFDTERERNLAIGDTSFRSLSLYEFNEDQIRSYLASINYNGSIPNWIPARPLLLCTVFALGMSRSTQAESWSLPSDSSQGWQILLDAICEREARIEAGVSSSAIRAILEHLAYQARSTASGLGPIAPGDIQNAYTAVTNAPPSPESMTVLQRLPGLGVAADREDGSRYFIDEDLVDACAASICARIVVNPTHKAGEYSFAQPSRCLGEVGSGIFDRLLHSHGFKRASYFAAHKALERANVKGGVWGDLFLSCLRQGHANAVSLALDGLEVPLLVLSMHDLDLSRVQLNDCILRKLEIDGCTDRSKLPRFKDCLIEYLDGIHSPSDLPEDRFVGCEIENYIDSLSTNASVQNSDLPVRVRVLLTVLRKLFNQGISGRRESALRRGLGLEDARYLDEVLEEVRKAGLASTISVDTGPVWIPARRAIPRARAILASPRGVNDPILQLFSK